MEKLLVHSKQTNVELVEILKETDNALEDYNKNNKELREKLLMATKLLKEMNKEVTKLEIELELVNEENEVLE